MKRFLFFGLLMFCCFVFVSCSQDVSLNEDEHLVVISNVGSISNEASKVLGEGAPIEGVLLKYHNEGLYGTSEFDLSNPNAFYLEELKDTESTWYGMKFNYVLYVPDCIQRVYKSGLGVNPNSGNPFWWYMSTYYDMNLSQIENDWNRALNILLENRSFLSRPIATDVGKEWYGSSSPEKSKIYDVSEIHSKVVGFILSSYDGDSFYAIDNYDLKKTKNGYEYNFTLYYPNSIRDAYKAGNGKNPTSGNPFWWYVSTYYNLNLYYVEEHPLEVLGLLLNGNNGLEFEPRAEDVKDSWLASK